MKSKKIFRVAIVLGLFFFSPTVLAQGTGESGSVANPLCWTYSSCKAMIEENKWKFSADNFLVGGLDNVCGPNAGYCIPAGQTDAEITIGGKIKFSDLGDYLKTIYLFALSVGGLIAVILIIIGGFIYLTSAGSAEKVTAAKTRISSAIFGLLLLLGAYTLLYTINPDLVRLRLPKTYMVRPAALAVEFCKDLPLKTMVAFAGSFKSSLEVPEGDYKYDAQTNLFSSSPALSGFLQGPRCGHEFFWENSDNKTCWGHACNDFNSAVPKVCVKQSENSYFCQEGNLSGVISSTDVPFPYIDNKIELIGICKNNGDTFFVQSIAAENLGANSQKYKFNVTKSRLENQINSTCGSGGVLGFYLGVEVNDEGGAAGGCDDWFALGQQNGLCNVNLSKLLLPSDSFEYWSCKALSYQKDSSSPRNSVLVPKENLFSLKNLEDGFNCNINLTRSEFPSLDNSDAGLCLPIDPTRCFINK